MTRRPSDTRMSYDSDNHFNSVFDRGPLGDRFEEKRKSLFGSGYFDSYNPMSRASSTDSLLEDLSFRATTLFHSLDPNQRGFINKEDLFSLNSDLNEDDLLDVFSQLDQDKDGCINVEDFKAGLKLINKQIHRKNLEKRRSKVDSITGWSPPHEYQKASNPPKTPNKICINMRSSDEGMSLFSCEEKICDLYDGISTVNCEFAEQFNIIIEIILNDMKELSKEKQGLIAKFHREKLMYENSLRHLEEEYESQIELICKKETKSEADKIEKDYRLLLVNKDEEIMQLKERLKDSEENFRKVSTTAEIVQTIDRKDEIIHLQRENNNLQVQLSGSQTENTMIRSELVTMKQQYLGKISQLQQENNNLRPYEKDWQNLMKQLQMLREINRKLQDTNDHLRSAIECSPSASEIIRRLSGSTPPIYNLEGRLAQCDPAYQVAHVKDKLDGGQDSIMDEHGDSGLSTLRDVTELESEVEPMNIFSEIYAYQAKSMLSSKSMVKMDELYEQTQSLDHTVVVSRPNSLPTDRIVSRKYSRESSLPQKIDPGDLSASSGKGSTGKQRTKERRKYQSKYKDRQPKGDASDSEYPNDKVDNYTLSYCPPIKPKPIHCMPERLYKIVFAGDASVGKSTFILRLCTDSFIPDCMTTIGMDFRNKTIEVDGKYIGLQLWDTAGQERFRSMTANYFRKADGVLLLYDCTYPDSFIHVRDWVETIRSAATDEIPIVLVSNKSDLRERYTEEGRKTVSRELGVNFAADRKLIFMETSAKSGENILTTMEELAKVLAKNEDLQVMNTNIDLAKQNLKAQPSNTSSSCCK